MEVISLIVGMLFTLVIGICLGWFFNKKTDHTIDVLVNLVANLPGGEAAIKRYEEIKSSGKVRLLYILS